MIDKERDYQTYERENNASDPGDNATIVGPLELTYRSRLVFIEIDSDNEGWFEIVSADHDGSNETIEKKIKKAGDGVTLIEGEVDDPILKLESQREIFVRTDGAVTGDVSSMFRVAEKRM